MEVTKQAIDNHMERKLVLYSIMSTKFLHSVVKIVKMEHFKAPFSKTVFKWCKEYYDQYNQAPLKNIQELYLSHRLNLDETEADTIGIFLQSLSGSTIPDNMDFEIKQATDWIRLRSAEVLSEKLTIAVAHKDFVEAENLIARHSKIEHIESHTIDIFSEKNIQNVIDAFNMDDETLFKFPKALGKLVGDIKVGDFFAWLAPLKRGKSFLLQYSAMTALEAGRRVLYINLEMTEPQMLRRIFQALTFAPRDNEEVKIPYFYREDDMSKWQIGYNVEERKAFRPDENSMKDFLSEYKTYHPHGGFRIATFPAKSTSVNDLRKYVDNLIFYEDFTPEVIVIDHGDLLLTKGNDLRVGLGQLWAELRGWASQCNIALITASQSNRASISAATISAENVSEDISKLQAVTGCVSINATKSEMLNGIYRFYQVAVREGSIYTDQVVSLNCLPISAINIDSRFLSEIEYELPKEMTEGKKKKYD